MDINTLVYHKGAKSLGIGCISKVLKVSCKVNFGLYDVKSVKLDSLIPIDTSECKTIPYSKLRTMQISNSDKLDKIIIGNELKKWVGIGWTSLRVVTESDLKKYKRVV